MTSKTAVHTNYGEYNSITTVFNNTKEEVEEVIRDLFNNRIDPNEIHQEYGNLEVVGVYSTITDPDGDCEVVHDDDLEYDIQIHTIDYPFASDTIYHTPLWRKPINGTYIASMGRDDYWMGRNGMFYHVYGGRIAEYNYIPETLTLHAFSG